MKESAVVRQVMDWLAAERIFAFRLNTSATKAGNRFFRAHSLGPGAADIFALPQSRWYSGVPEITAGPISAQFVEVFTPTWIECKTETGRQSDEQLNFQEYVESLGHKYVLARSVDDIRALWQERVK